MRRFFPSYPVSYFIHRTPSKLDVSARKPKHETETSLTDNKPYKIIVNDLRLIILETNLEYYTDNFVFSALYKDRTKN